MEKINLIKSAFYNEEKTKKELAEFILNSDILSMNKYCSKFEEKFSQFQNRKYSVFVSNGSCANLLLIQALLNSNKLIKGDEILVSSLTWSTNIMPLIQLGLKPILVDAEIETLNVSPNTLNNTIDKYPNIKGLFLTNVLGFSDNIEEIKQICENKNILFFEDNCESIGSEYNNIKLGNFGIASTFSFFIGHHMSTIEGGMICTDDDNLYENLKLSRAHGWTRNNSNNFKNQLQDKYEVDYFYMKYSFFDLAYNFRPNEINGFLGLKQMEYVDEIIKKREENFNNYFKFTQSNDDIIKLNLIGMNKISNFAFPLVFKNKEIFKIYLKKFEINNIEVRPIIAGDMQEQPFFQKYVKEKFENKNSKKIHESGLYIPNNPELTDEELNRIIKVIKNE